MVARRIITAALLFGLAAPGCARLLPEETLVLRSAQAAARALDDDAEVFAYCRERQAIEDHVGELRAALDDLGSSLETRSPWWVGIATFWRSFATGNGNGTAAGDGS